MQELVKPSPAETAWQDNTPGRFWHCKHPKPNLQVAFFNGAAALRIWATLDNDFPKRTKYVQICQDLSSSSAQQRLGEMWEVRCTICCVGGRHEESENRAKNRKHDYGLLMIIIAIGFLLSWLLWIISLDYYGLLQWIMASKSQEVNPMPHPPVCYTPNSMVPNSNQIARSKSPTKNHDNRGFLRGISYIKRGKNDINPGL